jgi:hypothetical protein
MTALAVVPALSGWEQLKALVLDSVSSPHSRRSYARALGAFHEWYRPEEHGPFARPVVQAYRAELERQGLASSTVNVRLAALRKLALEAAENGLLAAETAAGVARVRGARQAGIRAGYRLTREEAERLLRLPDVATLKGKPIRRCSPCWSAVGSAAASWGPDGGTHPAAGEPLGAGGSGRQGKARALRAHARLDQSRRRPLDRSGGDR